MKILTSKKQDEIALKLTAIGIIAMLGEISDTEFVMFGDDFCSYGERE